MTAPVDGWLKDAPHPDRWPLRTAREIGDVLRAARLYRGLTQQALADRASLYERTVRKLEEGFSYPELPTIDALSAALGIGRSSLQSRLPPCREGQGDESECGGAVVIETDGTPLCLLCGSNLPWSAGIETGYRSGKGLFYDMQRSARALIEPGSHGSHGGKGRRNAHTRKPPRPTTVF